MGTSAAYSPSPNWSGVTSDVTKALNAGLGNPETAHNVLAQFVDQLCRTPEEALGKVPLEFLKVAPAKATEILYQLTKPFPKVPPILPVAGGAATSKNEKRGDGVGERKASGRSGGRQRTGRKAAKTKSITGSGLRPVARRLASFLSDIPKIGLREALKNAGLENPDGIPPEKLVLAVADLLVGDASLIIESEMRDALINVLERVCDEPKSLDEGESMLLESAYNLENVVQALFESYIMERFKTFFCEHEAAKHGYEAADRILIGARDYVSAELALEKESRSDLTTVDWAGQQGAQIVDAILQRTISIYIEEPGE